jgi:hypothetical protein
VHGSFTPVPDLVDGVVHDDRVLATEDQLGQISTRTRGAREQLV